MDIKILTTMLAGFLLPVAIIVFWEKWTNRFGALGGWFAAFTIIGPIWLVNHGMPNSLVTQSSAVFIDMGFAAATGLAVYGMLKNRSVIVYLGNGLAAIIGGFFAGLLLYLFF